MLTKRGVLAYLAKVYDPLGLVSPVLLEGKLIFRDICEARMQWDAPISDTLLKRWKKWEQALPHIISFTRSIPAHQEPLREVKLHSFGDAGRQGVCAAVYAVVKQDSGVVQGLVAARSRLAKPNLTMPRLELVPGHMAVNLAVNVRDALQELKIRERCPVLARQHSSSPLVKRQWRISTIRCESCEQNEKSRECAMATRSNF